MKKNAVLAALLCALAMAFVLPLGSCSDGFGGSSGVGSTTSATTGTSAIGTTDLAGKRYGSSDLTGTRTVISFGAHTSATVERSNAVGSDSESFTFTVSGMTVILKGNGYQMRFTYDKENDRLISNGGTYFRC